MDHISDLDLERYHLGMVIEEYELAPIEEHLLGCHACQRRATESDEFVDLIRGALASGVVSAPVPPTPPRKCRTP